jgi:3-deoxy-D-manno-octulosonate 8-phosphate phosphatase KdsC-like HAD superfamily phosphatase
MENAESKFIEQHLRELTVKVDRLLRVIVGDDEMAITGLAKKVEEHEKWINNQKLRNAKLMGGAGAVGAIVTYVLTAWDKIFN